MAYEINININGEIDGLGGSGVGQVDTTPKADDNASKQKRLGKYIAAQTIEPAIQKSISYITSNVELMTGSIAQQQRTDAIMQGISLGTTAYTNVAGGVAMATSMGMSSVAGGVIGLAITAINIGLDILFKQAQINLKETQEDNQRTYLYTRAGIAYSQSRRGN